MLTKYHITTSNKPSTTSLLSIMPTVNNHSDKFKKAQQNYARLEAIKSDVSALERVCTESLDLSRTAVLTKKRRKELMETTRKAKSRLIENVTIIQNETGAVAGTGDMNYVYSRLSQECGTNSDGTFDLNSLLSISPPSTTSANQSITPTPPVRTRSQCDIAQRQLVSYAEAESPDIHDIKQPSNGHQYSPQSLFKAIEPVRKKTKIVKKNLLLDLSHVPKEQFGGYSRREQRVK